MTITGKNLLVAIAFFGLLATSDSLQAGNIGKKFVGQLKRASRHELHRDLHRDSTRCGNPHKRCPLPRPYPTPRPLPVHRPVCHYFLGVWTTLVELAPPAGGGYQQPADFDRGPGTRVVAGHGEPTFGLRIDRTVEHSPACRAGLKPNDVLLSANGRLLRSKHDLTATIHHSGGHLLLLVLDGRTGSVVTMNVQLDQR